MRILIAEDDPTSLMMLSGILEKRGHECVKARNGTEAWEALSQPDAPKMAILDWMMPGMTGPEVCERVRSMETNAAPYLILLTARDDTSSVVQGLKSGADDYLSKPYDPDELLARINVGRRILDLQTRLTQR
ncbi:MAG: response regulator transcription factor, partial [Candidatus Hydrogenedentes bacterium]|nr:response regulator transcription factor [Candidatus Hydrogenedentota bacterium]